MAHRRSRGAASRPRTPRDRCASRSRPRTGPRRAITKSARGQKQFFSKAIRFGARPSPRGDSRRTSYPERGPRYQPMIIASAGRSAFLQALEVHDLVVHDQRDTLVAASSASSRPPEPQHPQAHSSSERASGRSRGLGGKCGGSSRRRSEVRPLGAALRPASAPPAMRTSSTYGPVEVREGIDSFGAAENISRPGCVARAFTPFGTVLGLRTFVAEAVS